jgi:hypothetical protein
MLNVGHMTERTCGGLSRRDLLQVGGLGAVGLSLADLLRAKAAAVGSESTQSNDEKACIFLWLNGGPSHFETFDPKPRTPDDIRGPYGPTATSVPGVQICELLPMTARMLDRVAIVRSMTSPSGGHSPIPMMTAFPGERTSHGAVLTKLKGFTQAMPPYVHIGPRLGVGGGNLGSPYNPAEVPVPGGKKVEMPQFSLSADISADRFRQRRELLSSIDRVRADLAGHLSVEKMNSFYRLAVEMLTSSKVREAFDLSPEPDKLRNRYGANHFGQSCLMARRLVEAGTRFVQVNWYSGPAWHGWDVHGADLGGMERMEQHLCPRLDQGLTGLLTDLEDRGMLENTLVVVAGEFGRTPKINKYAARDHWPKCFSVLMAGGGVPGGTVVGSSDKHGALPQTRPINPIEFAATIYHLMGIEATSDPRIRTFVRDSLPVRELIG